jgi:hypothetical protein
VSRHRRSDGQSVRGEALPFRGGPPHEGANVAALVDNDVYDPRRHWLVRAPGAISIRNEPIGLTNQLLKSSPGRIPVSETVFGAAC